jgi:hypothetical protein
MGSRPNNYALETNWSKVIGNVKALAGNFEPTSSLNGRRGVGIMMGVQGNAKALQQGDRVFIAGQRTVKALQDQMFAQKTYVAGMYPTFNGSGASYIIKASWFRANTRARLDYPKWAKLRRMEASIQNELHRRATSVSCNYIVPGVMFHGFVEGVFYVVSHAPGKLTPIDTFLASTPAKAMFAYRAVEGTIHAMWMLDATPMRVAKHTFALLSNGRGFYPMAVVLDYNNMLAFNEAVRRELRGKVTTFLGRQNMCAPLRSEEGTLEHIWNAFRSSAAWRAAAQKYKDIFVKKHASEKDVGQYLRNILTIAKRVNTARGPGAPPRRRRTMLGGALRGILRGRGGGRRASSNKNSPPLKIRKVATLPETNGWRPRKHSATWGAASRNTNNNGGRRVSRNPGPWYITSGTSGNNGSTYTPAASGAGSDSDEDGDGGGGSAPSGIQVSKGVNGLGAGILGAGNGNAATTPAQANRNNVNRYKRIKESWSSLSEAEKNKAVKNQMNMLEGDPSARAALNALKKPEGSVERVIHGYLFNTLPGYRKLKTPQKEALIIQKLNAAFKNGANKYTRNGLMKGSILSPVQHVNVIEKGFQKDAWAWTPGFSLDFLSNPLNYKKNHLVPSSARRIGYKMD